ncbi:MAG: urease accessory protein UreE [Alphaproteobacteria bacterium]|nr:urease accessory protein UreE [Alphaproteobacteria bacterium]
MRRATAIATAGTWPAESRADTVVLDWDLRSRRRMVMQAAGGLRFLLDLPAAGALRDGDGLVLDDGRIVAIAARPEALMELHAVDRAHLVRIAWHLGNRHLPVQLAGETLRIRADAVIADMVRGLGGEVVELSAPFDPEGGAYGHGQVHGHDHHDGHDHDHHDHDHHHPHGHGHDR